MQQLLGISYQVYEQETIVRRRLDALLDTEAYIAALETIRCELVEMTTEIRGLIGELRRPELEELGVAAAIQGHVERLKREAVDPLPAIELDLDPVQFDSAESSICLFRAAQEALRNALNYAQAQHIRVTLEARDGIATLVVEDDGCGFHMPARLSELASRGHYGLTGMAERVAWAGGELVVDSRPGAGTRVCIRVPLHSLTEDPDGPKDSSALGG